MTLRAEQKQRSRKKILDAAARRLRSEGMTGAGIAAVMSDAGLTHGAFYAHFEDKDELTREALVHALEKNRRAWMGKPQSESWPQRLTRLARRYLTPTHRQDVSESCALAALCSEAARGEVGFRQTFEQELLKTLSAVCDCDVEHAEMSKADDALAFMSLLIGSLTLSRAAQTKTLSNRLLKVGRNAAATVARYRDDAKS